MAYGLSQGTPAATAIVIGADLTSNMYFDQKKCGIEYLDYRWRFMIYVDMLVVYKNPFDPKRHTKLYHGLSWCTGCDTLQHVCFERLNRIVTAAVLVKSNDHLFSHGSSGHQHADWENSDASWRSMKAPVNSLLLCVTDGFCRAVIVAGPFALGVVFSGIIFAMVKVATAVHPLAWWLIDYRF